MARPKRMGAYNALDDLLPGPAWDTSGDETPAWDGGWLVNLADGQERSERAKKGLPTG